MNDLEIQGLIRKPKRITEPPNKDWKESLLQRRKDCRLVSRDGNESFRMFARQSTTFPENFSVGLVYEASDGVESIVLFRCNGPHGEFNRAYEPTHPHFRCHIHVATEEAIQLGRRAESTAHTTDQFVDLRGAMRFFLDSINVDREEQEKFFEADVAQTLFDLQDGNDPAREP